jgi:hypothetical protein
MPVLHLLSGSCSLSRVLKHVDALGQISSNKSAAQGLIAQTDNALIQCCVSGSGSLAAAAVGCWCINHTVRVWFGAASDVNQHTNYWEMCLLLILRRNTVTSASDYCWITVRLPARSAGLSTRQALFGAITQQTEARAGRPGRQAGGSQGMWYLITRALDLTIKRWARPPLTSANRLIFGFIHEQCALPEVN